MPSSRARILWVWGFDTSDYPRLRRVEGRATSGGPSRLRIGGSGQHWAAALQSPPPMHSKTPPRNRLAKVLPEAWRTYLVEQGVPKRKYTAVCRVTLTDGTVIDDLIVEQGWIIAVDREGLAGTFERRIPFDPRTIAEL